MEAVGLPLAAGNVEFVRRSHLPDRSTDNAAQRKRFDTLIDQRRLQSHIGLLRDMMLALRYREESLWLAMAVASPAACSSATAQKALTSAALIATQFGFPLVSEWLHAEVVHAQGDCN